MRGIDVLFVLKRRPPISERDGRLPQSWLGDPDEQRAGRARRYFRVTGEGKAALRESRDALVSLWSGVEEAVEEA